MQVLGNYKRFWGSDQWSIKIDFLFEKKKKIKFTNLLVEFKNDKTGLFNSFEVNDLCSCVTLMMKFSEGFGIAIFDRRLVNWLSEYFNEHGVQISSNSILNCLKKELDEKVDVKVKKLTIVDKTFADILEYNPDDLLINFDEYFAEDNWTLGSKDFLSRPIDSCISYESNGSKTTDQNEIVIKNNYNGTLDVNITLDTNKKELYSNIIIKDVISPEFKPLKVSASLVAPDKTVLGLFQPLEIKQDSKGLNITWKIDELKRNHSILIEYELQQRIPFDLTVNTNDGEKNYLRFLDIESNETNTYSVNIPSFIEDNKFTLSRISSLTALLPIELETQTILYLYPHYILKIIDLGSFQKVTFSEPFIELLMHEPVQLEGMILPVLTFYESFIPQIGAKLIKKIFRNNSFTNPIIMYNLETSSHETIELIEEYPSSVAINLFTLGNQDIYEQIREIDNKKELILKLNATNDTVLYSLTWDDYFDLEKALIVVRNTTTFENFDIFQSLSIESIVDQTNKNYLDFKKFKIHSEAENEKIRLRSFTLKILQKEKELESQVIDSELDKAFETLKQTDNLAKLKAKIKSGYENTFTPEETLVSTINQPVDAESIASQTITNSITTANDIQSEPDHVNASQSESTNESELDELDSFIRDFGGENGQNTVSDQQTIESSVVTDQPAPETTVEPISEPISEPTSETTSELTYETTSKPEIVKSTEQDKPSFSERTSFSDTKEVETLKVDEKWIEFTILFENGPKNDAISLNILESDAKVVYVDENGELLDISEGRRQPSKIYLKLPTNERFLILVLNPAEFLSAHIYGRWKQRNPLKYKVLLSNKIGKWQIRIQYLESGLTFDSNFIME